MSPAPARRFDVVLVRLDPAVGSEIQKTRPGVVVSPDELNDVLRTVIVAPMTSRGQPYPWRVPTLFAGMPGRVAIDQIRTVDRERLVKRLGTLDPGTAQRVLEVLAELFAP